MLARNMKNDGSAVERRRPWARFAALCMVLAGVAVSPVHAEGTRALQSADFVALDGSRVVMTLTLNEPSPQPGVHHR
jgi:hypothetical protein